MKGSILLIVIFLLLTPVWAQHPQAISYQTVIRDNEGQIIPDTPVEIRMSIRSGASDGPVVYAETHTSVTSSLGLINLAIGYGIVVTGNFGSIPWGLTSYFLETAIDITGNGQFTVMGVTQLLSVPYALYSGQSGGIMILTPEERDAIQNPPQGMQIYNSATRCLNYFMGDIWYEACGTPVSNQPPSLPVNIWPPDNAQDISLNVLLQWNCSDPENESLVYDLYFGTEYPPPIFQSFLTDNSYPVPNLLTGQTYYWKIVASDQHGNSTEGEIWSFMTLDCDPPAPFAGADASVCETGVFQISGATGGAGITDVLWSTAGDGTFSNPAIINPVYTPGPDDILNQSAVLTLTAFSPESCPSASATDAMTLTLAPLVEVFAGPDITICQGPQVAISEAYVQYCNQFHWYTYDGYGSFSNAYEIDPVYYPAADDWLQGSVHLVLAANGIYPCNFNNADTLAIWFTSGLTAEAGADQYNVPGNVTVLEGNQPPEGGYGVWNILNGTGGLIAEPGNPQSQFTGIAGNSYILEWRLFSDEGCLGWDEVQISFSSGWNCGQSFTDTRDGKVYNTVLIGNQCWMAQNLNIGTRIASTANQTNNSVIEKYCYTNSESNCDAYGGLYQWPEIMQYSTTPGVQGICPDGWHFPTKDEWCTLTVYLDPALNCSSVGQVETDAGGKMKETGTTHWISPNTGATNSSGFTGLPGGSRDSDGSTDNLRYYGYWAYSTSYDATSCWAIRLDYNNAKFYLAVFYKMYGYSVRCLKN